MAFDGIRSIEWYAHNEARAYPLVVSANGKSVDQTFTLPNAAILSLYLYLPWSRDVDPSRFFISQLTHVNGFIELVVSYSPPSSAAVVVAAARAPSQASDAPIIREFVPSPGWPDVAGSVTFGTRTSLGKLPLGVFAFNFENTQLEVDCIRPSARNLSGLLVENADETFELATGVVNLRSGQNVRLRVQEVSAGVRDVWIDAIDRQSLNEDCECGDVLTNPIRTINLIQPDNNGNFAVTGAKCLDINTAVGAMSLDNPCSTPCCGCEEAEALQEAINRFAPQLNTLANFAPRLSAQMDRIEFYVQSADLRQTCDDDTGLPPSITTTSTTTTTSPGPLAIAAIEQLAAADDLTAGLANNNEDGTTYDIDWLFAVADASAESPLPYTCVYDDCGAQAIQPIAAATLPTISRPSTSSYDLLLNFAPGGSDDPCSSSLWDAAAPYRHMRIFGRVYVPAPVFIFISSQLAQTVDGDSLSWGFNQRRIDDGIASYDLTTLPVDPAFATARVRQYNRTTTSWCTLGNWSSLTTFSTAVLNSTTNGYLLLAGWHDIVFDVRRSSKPRGVGSHQVPLTITTRAACRVTASTRQYRLVLLNYGDSTAIDFTLAADVGSVSPGVASSHTMRAGGVLVTVDADATEITATAGDLVIIVPLSSVPARAAWNNHQSAQPSPTDNYVIPITVIPTCE
jgi:hypothetical protein